MSVGEKRLVLSYRLAFIVKHRPAASDPPGARVGAGHNRSGVDDLYMTIGIAPWDWLRFRLKLLLNLAAESVGVREAMLNLCLLSRGQIGLVSFPSHRVHRAGPRLRRRRGLAITIQVVDQPRRSLFENIVRISKGIREVSFDDCVDQIGFEIREQISERLAFLAHHSRTDDHSKSIERDLRSVSVGIGDFARLQDSIVVFRFYFIARGVLHRCGQQVVLDARRARVVSDYSVVQERVLKAVRQKKMSARMSEFLVSVCFVFVGIQ